MHVRHLLTLVALATAPFAESLMAAGPVCAPSLRAGRVVSSGSADCSYSYRVAGVSCDAKGKCPDNNGQKQDCIVVGDVTYAWTITKTGGTGSVSPLTGTGGTMTVTVVPPVDYTVACTISGCRACCSLSPPGCSAPEPPAASAPAAPEAESKKSCGGR